MTLGFTTKINGQPNYFAAKIILATCRDEYDIIGYSRAYLDKFPGHFIGMPYDIKPKLHTFRDDIHDRWHAGKKIHAVVGNRTPKRYQFVPLFDCISTQLVRIDSANQDVFIQEPLHYRRLAEADVKAMALNDGFNSTKAFFTYFKNSHSNLKLIHWTDLKY